MLLLICTIFIFSVAQKTFTPIKINNDNQIIQQTLINYAIYDSFEWFQQIYELKQNSNGARVFIHTQFDFLSNTVMQQKLYDPNNQLQLIAYNSDNFKCQVFYNKTSKGYLFNRFKIYEYDQGYLLKIKDQYIRKANNNQSQTEQLTFQMTYGCDFLSINQRIFIPTKLDLFEITTPKESDWYRPVFDDQFKIAATGVGYYLRDSGFFSVNKGVYFILEDDLKGYEMKLDFVLPKNKNIQVIFAFGWKENVQGGEYFVRIYQKDTSLQWSMVHAFNGTAKQKPNIVWSSFGTKIIVYGKTTKNQPFYIGRNIFYQTELIKQINFPPQISNYFNFITVNDIHLYARNLTLNSQSNRYHGGYFFMGSQLITCFHQILSQIQRTTWRISVVLNQYGFFSIVHQSQVPLRILHLYKNSSNYLIDDQNFSSFKSMIIKEIQTIQKVVLDMEVPYKLEFSYQSGVLVDNQQKYDYGMKMAYRYAENRHLFQYLYRFYYDYGEFEGLQMIDKTVVWFRKYEEGIQYNQSASGSDKPNKLIHILQGDNKIIATNKGQFSCIAFENQLLQEIKVYSVNYDKNQLQLKKTINKDQFQSNYYETINSIELATSCQAFKINENLIFMKKLILQQQQDINQPQYQLMHLTSWLSPQFDNQFQFAIQGNNLYQYDKELMTFQKLQFQQKVNDTTQQTVFFSDNQIHVDQTQSRIIIFSSQLYQKKNSQLSVYNCSVKIFVKIKENIWKHIFSINESNFINDIMSFKFSDNFQNIVMVTSKGENSRQFQCQAKVFRVDYTSGQTHMISFPNQRIQKNILPEIKISQNYIYYLHQTLVDPRTTNRELFIFVEQVYTIDSQTFELKLYRKNYREQKWVENVRRFKLVEEVKQVRVNQTSNITIEVPYILIETKQTNQKTYQIRIKIKKIELIQQFQLDVIKVYLQQKNSNRSVYSYQYQNAQICLNSQNGTSTQNQLNIAQTSLRYLNLVKNSFLKPYLCSTGCSECFSITECLKCSDGYKYNLQQRTCAKCPLNCKTCQGDGTIQCTSCLDGYFLKNFRCLKCNSKCLSCYSQGEYSCRDCHIGYYLNLKNNGRLRTCQKCPQNCDYCHNSSLCQTCSTGYSTTNKGSCVKCPLNCVSCDGDNTAKVCERCLQGFELIYHEQSFICQRCPLNCKICNNTKCKQCFTNYFLNQSMNYCSQLCDFPCSTCEYNSSTSCTSCIGGYSLNNKSLCIKDIKCNANYSCIGCPYGYAFFQGKCYECEPNSNCKSCDISDLSQCTICQDMYYLNEFAFCYPCSIDCQKCLSGSICQKCKDGWYLQSHVALGKCIPCKSPCLTCIQSQTNCISCINDYQLYGYNCINKLKINFTFKIDADIKSWTSAIYQQILNTFSLTLNKSRQAIHIISLKQGSMIVSGAVQVKNQQDQVQSIAKLQKYVENNKQIAGRSIISSEVTGFSQTKTVDPSTNKTLLIILSTIIPSVVIVIIILMILIYKFCIQKQQKKTEIYSDQTKSMSNFTDHVPDNAFPLENDPSAINLQKYPFSKRRKNRMKKSSTIDLVLKKEENGIVHQVKNEKENEININKVQNSLQKQYKQQKDDQKVEVIQSNELVDQNQKKNLQFQNQNQKQHSEQ